MNRDSKKIYNNYRFISEQTSSKTEAGSDQINLDEIDFENFDWGTIEGQIIPHIRLPEEKLKSVHDKVIKAIYLLKSKFPTIVDMLNHLRKVATYEVSTAAVDENFNLYYNPTFIYCLPLHYVATVLAHEAFHYLNNTFKRADWTTKKLKIQVDHKLWNIATDLTMNFELVRQGFKFPKGFFVPTKDGFFKFSDVNMGDEKLDISKNTSEQVYDFVKKNQPPATPGGEPPPQYVPKVGDVIGDKETNTKRKIVKIDKKNKKVITVPV